jgi:hypothetical protein
VSPSIAYARATEAGVEEPDDDGTERRIHGQNLEYAKNEQPDRLHPDRKSGPGPKTESLSEDQNASLAIGNPNV